MKPLPWHETAFAALTSRRAALPHALTLQGPRGIGKFVFAQAFAQALLCEAPAKGSVGCGQCSACIWFEAGTHPDYRQIELSFKDGKEGEEGERKTQIEVEQIRMLADFVNISSHRGGSKVLVVNPADALNANAANALLKSLEEPPPRTYFLLVAHRPHLLLPTIRSRCQQVFLRAPESAAATAWLDAQGVRNAPLALAHTGSAPLLAIELNGTGYWGARAAFLRHLVAPDIDVLAAGEAVRDCPIAHVISWLQKWSYDIAYYRALRQVRYNPDYAEAIQRVADRADGLRVLRFHRDMVQLQRFSQHPLNARLFIEQTLLAYRDVFEPQAAPA